MLLFFLQDFIESFAWFCIGYLFGFFFFFVLIKNRLVRKNPKKDIEDFFEKYKQTMAEKTDFVDNFQNLVIDEKIDLQEVFLKELVDKVKQLENLSTIDYKVDNRLMYFSFETQILRSQDLAEKLIDIVDNHTQFFFKPEGLAHLGWCAKYMLHSDFIHNRKSQLVQFVWFKNLFRHKLCPCFVCDSYAKTKK